MAYRSPSYNAPLEPESLSGLLIAPFVEAAQLTSDILTSRKTHIAVVRIIVLGAIIGSAITGAVAAYLTFYWLFIPEIGLAEPVYLQYGHSRPPFARIDLLPTGDYLANDQPYDVSIELVVPNTPNNLALGNFMVSVDFRSADDRSVYVVSRPAAVAYSPAAIRAMQAFSDVRSLLGMPHAQSQRLQINLVEKKVLQRWSQANKISHALVTVGRADAYVEAAYQGGRGELQVYETVLHFDAHFSGLRYIMYHYRVLSFLTFTSMFVVFEVVTALGAWAFIAYRRGSISPYADPMSAPRPLRPKRPAYDAIKRSRRRARPIRYEMDDPSLRPPKREEEDVDLGKSVSDNEEEEEDDENGSWEGIETAARAIDETGLKREDEDVPEVDSTTSRGTRSSLGSFPATASSGTTASSSGSGSNTLAARPARPDIIRRPSVEEGSTTSQEDAE